MYQLIVFDWDGTLMDSAQKIANCIQASARDLGLPEPSDQQAKSIIGLGLTEAMQHLFDGQSPAIIQQIVEAYKYHYVTGDVTEQKLFEGVEDGLRSLNDAGALLAVATGKSRAGLERVFGQLDVREYFVTTRCADETRSKPHPQMLHEILDYTAIDPARTIMIGDTTFDMDMAAGAGMDGLGAGYGVHSEALLRQANAVDVLHSFNAVLEWLLSERIEKAYG